MSVTVAFAADIASIALTLSFGVGCEPPLGSNARMTVSQNAIRRRNRMRCLELPYHQWAQLWRSYQQVLKPWFLGSDAFCRYSTRISRSFFTNFQRSAFGSCGSTWPFALPPACRQP